MSQTVEDLQAQLEALRQDYDAQQRGALLYIAAIVKKAVGVGVEMRLSAEDMIKANDLILERAESSNGGLALRLLRPPEVEQPAPSIVTEHRPVLAKATPSIVLLDPSGRPNQ